MVALHLDSLNSEEQARSIDLEISAKIKNVVFCMTDFTSRTCFMIVSESYMNKFESSDSLKLKFREMTGFPIKSYDKTLYNKEIFFKLYSSAKYYYESFKTAGDGAPRLYRTGNMEKDNINYNTALAIWKEQTKTR
ncbi:MAG: hypothetical protein A2W91_02060 [Bacteroidetes bacterium GWF2_38_335]|nr:MAG: hypothetical protein A2W91_02060 [Bacteroidetes bacterium GWF2_38_335]OFY80637.1 MAG: hypothetical protein A2281_05075 [Bacteroidetes bacterium RIFOXYA12_FULL_38_20]HBS86978.1 hypothetical protein [Bacteroidales bacterium]